MAELTGACNLEPMVSAAAQCIEDAGHETLIVCSGTSCNSELRAWEVLARSSCDGIILHSDVLNNDQLARIKSSRPNVVFSHIDHRQSSYIAANLLIKLGHTRIAMVAGPAHRYSTQHRNRGFEQAMESKAATGVNSRVITAASLNPEAGADAMQILLADNPRPTALFFHHEALAMGAIAACEKSLFRIPEDISILTCCNQPESLSTKETMCMVRQPLADIGVFAARRVLDLTRASNRAYTSQTRWPAPFADLKSTILDLQAPLENDTTEPCSLSPRECECLEWAAKGKTSWETSQILGITESTIIYHLRNATRKLNAANRLHAVTKALKASLIEF